MLVLLPLLFLILSNPATDLNSGQELHYFEAGTAPVLMRSAFAHGYRHGYEEGYHLGNIDINMGRKPHTKFSQFHGLSSHYSPTFGPRKSFEWGFQQGVRAGYMDGFVGRMFRGLESLRLIAAALNAQSEQTDPRNIYFDQGISAGYGYGLDMASKEHPQPQHPDSSTVSCPNTQSAKQIEAAVRGAFCDGYRRGYLLGHADGVVLGPNPMFLASRQ